MFQYLSIEYAKPTRFTEGNRVNVNNHGYNLWQEDASHMMSPKGANILDMKFAPFRDGSLVSQLPVSYTHGYLFSVPSGQSKQVFLILDPHK
ncbi:MAG: hypothetical protein LBQ60_20000 [Bacteroidales bacterium]|jgi:hypothetical protein|nr:hypothetical protein [Bacteroidales bacterium]